MVFFFLNLKSIDQPLRQKLGRLDWGGIALFTAGCTLFASLVAWAGAMFPWGSYQTLVPLLLGVVLLAGSAWYESKPIEPVFPHRMFASRTACLTIFASFLHRLVNYSVTLYIPLLFQAIHLDAPLQAAVQVLPFCFLAIGTAVIAAVAVDILRRYRLLILVSWVFMAVGAGVLTLLGPDSSPAAKESYQVILGMDIGPFWSVLNLPLQASMENVDDMGLATRILCSFRLFGGLIGLALSSTIFNTIFKDRIKFLGPLPGDFAILGDVRHAVGFIPMLKDAQLPAQWIGAVLDVYKKSVFGVYWMIAGVSAVEFLLSICIEEKSLEREELGRQRFEEKKRGSNPASETEEQLERYTQSHFDYTINSRYIALLPIELFIGTVPRYDCYMTLYETNLPSGRQDINSKSLSMSLP